MAIVKSKLIKQIKKSYPNFLIKDLDKLTSIILNEIKNTLKRGERVELRGFGVLSTRVQRESLRRNPKTGQKIMVKQKKIIHWKMSKDLFKKINNEK